MGNCLDHSHASNDSCAHDVNPLSTAPVDLVRGLRAVLKGVLGVMASYTVSTVRGFEKWEMNEFIREQPSSSSSSSSTTSLVCRLHNDDVHGIDTVIVGLMGVGHSKPQATALTMQVDKEGEAVVAQGSPSDPKILAAYRRLKTESGLLFSMVPEHIVALEPRMVAAFQWMLSLGGAHDGLRRAVVEELLAEVTRLRPLSDTATAGNFSAPDQFPSVLSHLSDPAVPLVSLAHPVYHSPPATGGAARTVEENGADFESRLTHPFDHCHTNTLSLNVLASPFLSKALKRAVIEVVIRFQHDSLFKAAFSQILTVLYPALCVLHCRNIGTLDSSIFHTSVQVYTANSVVALMSSDGVRNRLLPEFGRPIMITKMLMSTFIAVLRDVGCRPELGAAAANADDFLTHHSIRTHRISQICRDMEYVTSDSFFCARLLRGDVDFGVVRVLLFLIFSWC